MLHCIIQCRMFGKYYTLYEGSDLARATEYVNLISFRGFTFNVSIRGA